MLGSRGWSAALVALALVLVAPQVQAFCGFYVGGADAKLFNDATMVVMMRDGTRTVLSMQNTYAGPPENFAMVVPVPVVLQKENVKTLPDEVFDRIDRLAAPRLVEYWEQDPCWRPPTRRFRRPGAGMKMSPPPSPAPPSKRYGVKVEAEFTVGEYDIVILSANDSGGLDAWLRDHDYTIPAGAEAVLRPYVQQGMKFFVAKVDIGKVKMTDGRAELSPLRFHYDTEHFALPVRLGLMNANGAQDLIVHILAREQRYEVANFDNISIPTNVEVVDGVRKRFGEFYAALFDEVMARNPRSVVTEYAWQATSCDPCPGPPLRGDDFATLGGDVLPSVQGDDSLGGDPRWGGGPLSQFVLTRLHARYDSKSLGEDLVFRKAKPIVGGREMGGPGQERVARVASSNNFQGRYIIRHPWTGPIRCQNPVRGRWGGPWPSVKRDHKPQAGQDLAFAPRGKVPLRTFVKRDVAGDTLKAKGAPMGVLGSIGKAPPSPAAVPSTALPASAAPSTTAPVPVPAPAPTTTPTVAPPDQGCGSCSVGSPRRSAHPSWWLALLGLLWRRRRSS